MCGVELKGDDERSTIEAHASTVGMTFKCMIDVEWLPGANIGA